jgi:hypothetical protein
MAADGIDMSQVVPVNDPGGSPAQGTGQGQDPQPVSDSSAGTSNTVETPAGGPPDTIPYSRFSEVNSRLQELRPYEALVSMGIDPDSAVRLASFEQAYMQDPVGTLASLIDQQTDLPDARKTALKELLTPSGSQDGARTPDDGDGEPVPELPAEAKEAVAYVAELKREREQADTQRRLDHMLDHWQRQDEQDGVQVTSRQRLLYIQSVAGSDVQFQSLEDMSDAARNLFLQDRDANLGSVVQHRGTGTPRAVPSGGLPPMPPIVPKSMKEARKLIEADIAAGRLPDLSPE